MRTKRTQHYKEYASDAFRLLGKYGSSAEYKRRVLDAVERRREELGTRIDAPIGSPTEAQIIKAEEAIEDAQAVLQDLEAAERAMMICKQRDAKNATMIVKAVQAVYMLDPHRLLKHKEIMNTVIAFSILAPCDKSTVYRWLSIARTLFARERGLRIKD